MERWYVPPKWTAFNPPLDKDTVLPAALAKKCRLFLPNEDTRGHRLEWRALPLESGARGPEGDAKANPQSDKTPQSKEGPAISEAQSKEEQSIYPCFRCVAAEARRAHAASNSEDTQSQSQSQSQSQAAKADARKADRAERPYCLSRGRCCPCAHTNWEDIELAQTVVPDECLRPRRAPLTCPYCPSVLSGTGSPELDAVLRPETLPPDVSGFPGGKFKIFQSNSATNIAFSRMLLQLSPPCRPHVAPMTRTDWQRKDHHLNYENITSKQPNLNVILLKYSDAVPRTHIWIDGFSIHTDRLVKINASIAS